jgi:prepilin-type N-terminal cleavage/methylation domain-containing protein
MQKNSRYGDAFTLIELLVVIAIIAILIGFLFPAYHAVQNQARKTQAKNDLTQIVTAVNAYYTEYGKYPLVAADTIYGLGGTSNAGLFYTLRAVALGANAADVANPRKIVFINPPDVKDPVNPRAGIATQAATVNGNSVAIGEFVDPWGTQYAIAIDGGYDNQLVNPYALNAGATPLYIGVIAWSFAKDAQSQSIPGPAADKTAGTNDDDVISWQ